ncbi:uncharacterized protein LOC103385814 isoform X2 [Cynoglossus semilaevis]|uniref:uncharacterized protein LOC103385814 isoform X1 n=1 Tax=Cynoglossus semilaevis TaxID=244447 RepID=UPI000D624B5A|nr:uncharacterized protein LOC103385814 isoform X1 [Cynoglossus semilaevis]XP_024915877.1 uncharacterized protein LOC103385814 isoform X2 [Cynoglossus semilaevis]
MAGRLLFLFLMCSSQRMEIQALLSPKLTVTKLRITETETDTLECRPVDVVTASQCYFYTLTKEETKVFSCLKLVTGTELLLMSGQTSPAEVQLRCFYTVNLNGINPSPHSNTVSVIVNGNKKLDDMETSRIPWTPAPTPVSRLSSTLRTTINDETDGGTFTSTHITAVTAVTVGRTHTSTEAPTVEQPHTVTDPTVGGPHTSPNVIPGLMGDRPNDPTPRTQAQDVVIVKLLLVMLTTCGVTMGVVSLVALYCRRKQAHRDDVTRPPNLDHEEEVNYVNNVYTLITAVDASNEFDTFFRQKQQRVGSEHVYEVTQPLETTKL